MKIEILSIQKTETPQELLDANVTVFEVVLKEDEKNENTINHTINWDDIGLKGPGERGRLAMWIMNLADRKGCTPKDILQNLSLEETQQNTLTYWINKYSKD